MILISHRGNINGRADLLENQPNYIDGALNAGFDVEADVWMVDDNLYLGHDAPQYSIDAEWLSTRAHALWVHCKNIKAVEFFHKIHKDSIHYFWHETDTITLTSKHYIWAFPGKQPIKNSISVMPEIYNEDVVECIGVCSDYINKYNLNVRYR